MPLYEYQCPHCGRFETIRKFADPPLTACPTCGRAVEKLASAPAIQFKGTGWYITDYARKSSGGDSSPKGDGKGKTPSEGSSKAGESGSKAGESGSKSDAASPTATASKDGAASGGGSTKS